MSNFHSSVHKDLLPLFSSPLEVLLGPANYYCDLDNLKFSSKNFKNILTWSTSNKAEVVHYNVMYKIYGNDTWWEKSECTNITQNSCDLTNETSTYTEQYYGKVVISNQVCNISSRTDKFDPLLETILDPPNVILFFTGTSITINLTHVVENLSSIYGLLKYQIKILGLHMFTTEEPYYKIEHLDLQTTYCVSARLIYPTYGIFSNKTCITTKTDHTSEERVKMMLYILVVILFIFIVFGSGYGVHKYIHVGNLKHPQILNITSNNNNNVVLFDAHNVTINVIKIVSGKLNEQSTMTADKEEKTQVEKDLYFTDGGYDASDSLGVTDDDHGYVSLLEQVPGTGPKISPYDMPHNLLEIPVKPSMSTSLLLNKEEDVYGRLKHNSNIESTQEKDVVEAHQTPDMSEETFTYLPKNDQNVPKLDVLNHELYEIEESSIGQDAANIDVTNDTDFSECDTLFVDWSPTSHQIYIPNFHNRTVDVVCTEECQEVEGLLSHLYKPIQIQETSEELDCLEQKWELHVKMQE
ncbi:uncharacterized protein LOC142760528 [Rhinoderma darwinii]|uniref:uncharacterized protein LOC142760528 n=1 Tax=Rhinoderma darwinii TaxID=43563 RepID=UPI003F66939B